ncbi:MAG: diguanylate cyclase [Campylobacterota bacterium]|nr:diguanylate cyclase [Campylobacterota bacterium]
MVETAYNIIIHEKLSEEDNSFSEQDRSMKKNLVINFSYATAVIFLVFGINYLFKDALLLGVVETTFGILQIINIYFLKKTDRLGISAKALLFSIYIMTLIIFVDGGLGNTGNLWLLFIPLFTMLLLDQSESARYLIAYMLIVAAILIMSYFEMISLKYSTIELRQTLVVFTVLIYLTFYNEQLKKHFHQEIQENNEMLQRISKTDHLTGLANRLHTTKFLEDEYERSQRYDRATSLIMVDIDHFKTINDNYGHLKGDDVLIKIADIFKQHIRQNDLAGRWGGEEFLIICPETTLEGAKALAEKFRVQIEQTDYGLKEAVTGSFGVVQYQKGDSLKKFILQADDFLYKAKGEGRNRVISS